MKHTSLYKHRVILGVVALATGLGTVGVRAEVDDPWIYSLTDASNGGTGTVLVCGTVDCAPNGVWGVDPPAGSSATDANTRDLTDAGSIGYAIFNVYEVGPAGSGFIDPFLRFQHNEGPANGNANIETAYNTNNDDLQRSADPTGPNNYEYINQAKDTVAGGKKDPGDFNHAILYDDMEAVDGRFTFWLDINEPNSDNKSTLRLDELSFFISTSDTLGVYDPQVEYDSDGVADALVRPDCSTASGGSTSASTAGSLGCFRTGDNDGAVTRKVWDMDLDLLVGSTLLENDNSLSAGSGDFDLNVSLSAALFEAYIDELKDGCGGCDLYVYLENTAGSSNTVESSESGEVSAGFEEWAFNAKTDLTIPVPGTLLLTGLGLLLLGRRVRL
jgi:hypothetical protein